MKILDNNCIVDFDAFAKKFPKEAAILSTSKLELCFEIEGNKLYFLDQDHSKMSISIHSELEYHKRYFYKNSIYKELLAKALGLKKGQQKPKVFDATAGVLKDSLLIHSLGLELIATERNPLAAVLIQNALNNDPVENLNFKFQEANLEVFDCDVAYYDPMYNHKNSKASPKKEMRIFREFIGDDLDDRDMGIFLKNNYKRLVVKRSMKADVLIENPSIQFKGKSTRYDVYL